MAFDLDDPANIAAARLSPAGWANYCTRGKYLRPRHIQLFDNEVMRCLFDEGAGDLLAETGPRHGKSWYFSRFLIGWYFGHFPDHAVMHGSYAVRLGARFGSLVRRDLIINGPRIFDITISKDTRSKSVFEIDGHDGRFFAAGIEGGIHGEGANLLVTDDLVKGSDVTRSDVQMAALEEFVLIDLESRREPNCTHVGIQTRWAEMDPHGMWLSKYPQRYRRVSLPVIAEDDDILGRERGEALWPERYPLKRLEEIRDGMPSRYWNALYQQRPTALEGGVWKSRWWRKDGEGGGVERTYVIRAGSDGADTLFAHDGYTIPVAHMMKFVVTDLATTEKKSADYTAIGCFGLTTESPRRLVILDLFHQRMEGPKVNPRVKAMLEKWGARIAWYEKEGTQAMVLQYARRAGIPAKSIGRAKDCDLQISGDKVAVAEEGSPLVASGRLLVPEAHPVLADWEHEVLTFPNGAHDDLEDVFAWACHIAMRVENASLLTPSGSARPPVREFVPPRRRGDALDDFGPAAP